MRGQILIALIIWISHSTCLGTHVSLDCALEHNPFAYNLKIYQNRHIRSGLTQIFHSSLPWICWFWKDWQSCHVRNLLRQLRAQLLKYSGSKTTFIRLLLSSRMADSIKSSIVRLKRANWEETHTARVTLPPGKMISNNLWPRIDNILFTHNFMNILLSLSLTLLFSIRTYCWVT